MPGIDKNLPKEDLRREVEDTFGLTERGSVVGGLRPFKFTVDGKQYEISNGELFIRNPNRGTYGTVSGEMDLREWISAFNPEEVDEFNQHSFPIEALMSKLDVDYFAAWSMPILHVSDGSIRMIRINRERLGLDESSHEDDLDEYVREWMHADAPEEQRRGTRGGVTEVMGEWDEEDTGDEHSWNPRRDREPDIELPHPDQGPVNPRVGLLPYRIYFQGANLQVNGNGTVTKRSGGQIDLGWGPDLIYALNQDLADKGYEERYVLARPAGGFLTVKLREAQPPREEQERGEGPSPAAEGRPPKPKRRWWQRSKKGKSVLGARRGSRIRSNLAGEFAADTGGALNVEKVWEGMTKAVVGAAVGTGKAVEWGWRGLRKGATNTAEGVKKGAEWGWDNLLPHEQPEPEPEPEQAPPPPPPAADWATSDPDVHSEIMPFHGHLRANEQHEFRVLNNGEVHFMDEHTGEALLFTEPEWLEEVAEIMNRARGRGRFEVIVRGDRLVMVDTGDGAAPEAGPEPRGRWGKAKQLWKGMNADEKEVASGVVKSVGALGAASYVAAGLGKLIPFLGLSGGAGVGALAYPIHLIGKKVREQMDLQGKPKEYKEVVKGVEGLSYGAVLSAALSATGLPAVLGAGAGIGGLAYGAYKIDQAWQTSLDKNKKVLPHLAHVGAKTWILGGLASKGAVMGATALGLQAAAGSALATTALVNPIGLGIAGLWGVGKYGSRWENKLDMPVLEYGAKAVALTTIGLATGGLAVPAAFAGYYMLSKALFGQDKDGKPSLSGETFKVLKRAGALAGLGGLYLGGRMARHLTPAMIGGVASTVWNATAGTLFNGTKELVGNTLSNLKEGYAWGKKKTNAKAAKKYKWGVMSKISQGWKGLKEAPLGVLGALGAAVSKPVRDPIGTVKSIINVATGRVDHSKKGPKIFQTKTPGGLMGTWTASKEASVKNWNAAKTAISGRKIFKLDDLQHIETAKEAAKWDEVMKKVKADNPGTGRMALWWKALMTMKSDHTEKMAASVTDFLGMEGMLAIGAQKGLKLLSAASGDPAPPFQVKYGELGKQLSELDVPGFTELVRTYRLRDLLKNPLMDSDMAHGNMRLELEGDPGFQRNAAIMAMKFFGFDAVPPHRVMMQEIRKLMTQLSNLGDGFAKQDDLSDEDKQNFADFVDSVSHMATFLADVENFRAVFPPQQRRRAA